MNGADFLSGDGGKGIFAAVPKVVAGELGVWSLAKRFVGDGGGLNARSVSSDEKSLFSSFPPARTFGTGFL